MARVPWDVVVWSAGRFEEIARDLIARSTPPPPVLLVADGGGAGAVSAALAAGFCDVACDDAGRGELVARALAVARRSAAGRALAREVDMFRELAEGGRDLLVRQAPDGTIRYASAGARGLLGWDPGELVGRRASQILPAEALEAVTAPAVHRALRRDGSHLWMETTTRVIHDRSGRVREIQTDSRDVTGRVRAEAERVAVMRLTAAVAEGLPFARIAELVAREAAGLLGGESAAVVRFHGDEGMVLGAAGPLARVGDRVPVAAAATGVLQPEVANAPDTFQFQVSNLTRTTQTLGYSWTNTGSLADVNQSGQVTSGEAVLTIRDGSNMQVYSRNLKNTGTFITSAGATGSWRIEVRLTDVTGTLNFRVQKHS